MVCTQWTVSHWNATAPDTKLRNPRVWRQPGGIHPTGWASLHYVTRCTKTYAPERLTGDGKALRLTPLAAGGATLINSWTGIRSHDDVVLKPGGEAESWRVPPGTVPALPGVPPAAIGYRFGERPAPIELAVLPVRPEVRGHVEDHVTVY